MKNPILTRLQDKFLKAFFQTYLGNRFFLTGGTALAAFYLKHRISEDLDLFTLDQDLTFDEVNAEVRKIAYALKLRIDHRVSTNTFSQFFLIPQKGKPLKIDLVREVPIQFGKIKKKDKIRIDPLENIAVNKLLAIYGRLDGKDYVDFYFLIKERLIDFEQIFKKAQKKDTGLNKFYFANMIAEAEKIENYPQTVENFDKKELVNFYLNLSHKLLKEIKPKKRISVEQELPLFNLCLWL